MPDALSIYVGDDSTDEDAFAALPDGITVKVGEPTETTAGYYVAGPTEVEQFLEWLTLRPRWTRRLNAFANCVLLARSASEIHAKTSLTRRAGLTRLYAV